MKDEFYSDKRDLIKWGGIVYLCNEKDIKTVVQVAYYRQSKKQRIAFDNGKSVLLPEVVSEHFRNIKNIRCLGRRANLDIKVITREFKNNIKDREEYHKEVCRKIKRINGRKLVFLDPDTGLVPKKREAKHVTKEEVGYIWKSLSLKYRDILVFYQHKPRGSKNDWKEAFRSDFANRCELKNVRMWSADGIAKDVVLYFVQR